MDKDETIARIEAAFSSYKKLEEKDAAHMQALNKGKLYELYVLSELVLHLRRRGCRLIFRGPNLVFKAAPGRIKSSDPHFRVTAPSGYRCRLFVDIEFETLGSHRGATGPDRSSRHELDLVLVDTQNSYPRFRDVLLGVECKSQASFSKDVVKEVLGIRRELSFVSWDQPSRLSLAGASLVNVPAIPASEFWLAYDDPKGNDYRLSPAAFGVEFKLISLP